jgi:Alcohol dehydrogenase GroES-like domain
LRILYLADSLQLNLLLTSIIQDWKYPVRLKNYEAVEGNDVAGYVEAVGEGVTDFKPGDRVAAFSELVTREERSGAYAQYTVGDLRRLQLCSLAISETYATCLFVGRSLPKTQRSLLDRRRLSRRRLHCLWLR